MRCRPNRGRPARSGRFRRTPPGGGHASIHGAIWKNFIPYYYGADSGTRIEWGYAGKGRVVFTVNRYTSEQSVVRVDYDPNEDGK